MRKALLSTIIILTSITYGWAQGEIREKTIYYEQNGVSYEIYMEYRTAGTNSVPQVQFRLEPNRIKVRSYRYNGKYYGESDLMRIIYAGGGEYEDYPRDLRGNLYFYLDEIDADPVNCDVDTYYRSDEIVATQEGWNTLTIADSWLINCLREKNNGDWVEYGGIGIDISVSRVSTTLNTSALNGLIRLYEEEQGGNDLAGDVLDDYCNRNYSSESQIRTAISKVNEALNQNITVEWKREALERCRTNLQEQLSDLSNGDDDYTYVSPHDRYVALGDAAWSQGNFQEAWQYYRQALEYEDNYYTRQKRDNAYQKWEEQRAVQGAAMLGEGIAEMREQAPTGRLNGTFFNAFSFTAYNYGRTPGLTFTDERYSVSAVASLDYNTWFDRDRTIGWHYGVYGQYDSPPTAEGNSRDLQSLNKGEFGIYTGINLFGYVEVDYILRGLSMNGEVYGFDNTLDEYYTRNVGGGFSYDGGVRAAVYLLNQRDDFVRIVGYWIDSSPNSPIDFLDFTGSEVSTASMGYKVEWGHSPLAFYFFHSVDSYYPGFDAMPMGVDTWGIGIGWGTGIAD